MNIMNGITATIVVSITAIAFITTGSCENSPDEVHSMFIKQPQNILTNPSVNVTLYCVLADPSKSAIWCQNEFCTMGKSRSLPAYPRYSIVGDRNKGEHNLFIENVQESDMGSYQCQVPKTTPESPGYQSRIAYLTLIRSAKTISIHKPLQIMENELASITCLAEYSYPASRIKWQPEAFVKEYALNITHARRQLNRTNWSAQSTVYFIATPEWQGQRIDCWVIHDTSSAKRVVSTVVEFPTLPSIKIRTSLPNAPVDGGVMSIHQGQSINLTCENEVNERSEELITLRWFQINDTSTVVFLSEQSSSIFVKARRNLQNIVYLVFPPYDLIFFKDGPSFFTDKSKLHPWIGVRMQLVSQEDHPSQLTSASYGCYVDSNPVATIRWLYGNQIISNNHELTKVDLSTITGQSQEFQCVAIIPGLGTFARTLRLVRNGNPIIRPISQDVVDLGSNARLVCAVQILPKFNEVFWTNAASSRFISMEHVSSTQDEKYRIEESWTEEEMYSVLFINSVTNADIGMYNCCALNEHGMSSASVWLVVYESNYLNPLWSAIVAVMILTSVLSILVVTVSIYKRTKKQRIVINRSTTVNNELRAVSSNGGTIDFTNVVSSTNRNGVCSSWYGLSPFPAMGDAPALGSFQENPALYLQSTSTIDSTYGTSGMDAGSFFPNKNIQSNMIDPSEHRQQSTV